MLKLLVHLQIMLEYNDLNAKIAQSHISTQKVEEGAKNLERAEIKNHAEAAQF